jgi:general secretion pathway protein K
MWITSGAAFNTEAPRRREVQSGGALLAVLWLSAALAAVAFALATTVRGEVERTSTAVDGVRSYYLAAGAIERMVLRMLWWAQNPHQTPLYSPLVPVVTLPFPSGEALVEIVPETSKLNINGAPPEEIFRLLLNLGVEPARANAITLGIVDWRSPAPGGQFTEFDQFYLSLKPSFRARHASFEEIEELLLVRGMTPEIFYGTYQSVETAEGQTRLVPRDGLGACVSVFGARDQFDVNTARPAVLAAIGVPPDLVRAIVERRRVMPFRTEELAGLAAGIGPVAARLRVAGNTIFTVKATARLRLSNGQLSDMRRSAAAMVKFMPPGYDAPYHILRWYERVGTQ